jgi:hypothetical protein
VTRPAFRYAFCRRDLAGDAAAVRELSDAVGRGREVGYTTFREGVGGDVLDRWAVDTGYALDPRHGPHLKNDCRVHFHKSTWRGHPCYYADTARGEYVFLPEGVVR